MIEIEKGFSNVGLRENISCSDIGTAINLEINGIQRYRDKILVRYLFLYHILRAKLKMFKSCKLRRKRQRAFKVEQ